MRRIDWSSLDEAGRKAALARPARGADPRIEARVREILDDVRDNGGEAVARWSRAIDGAPPRRLAITPDRVAQARARLSDDEQAALAIAAANVRAFHQATRPVDSDWIETTPGVRSRRVWRPIGAAGLYAPGGSAPLFSSLLMLAVPAQVAGVPVRVAVTPPPKDGEDVHPAMILAALEGGLEALWLVGGAQAIAAMAHGAVLDDGVIAPADKLFGPGNAWVAEAKRQAAARPGGPAIDLPAGPSELLVIIDAGADPVIAAADLLSQAEHDADAQVVLVSDSDAALDATIAEVERQVADLPRAEIARASLAKARAIRVADLDEACAVANRYGPEHLALQTADAETLLDAITAAGAVFVGAGAAETLGDYAAGPSHVLPTDGAARTMGGVATSSFMTPLSVQAVTPDGARRLAPVAARLARMEGLEAHARAADLRTSS